MPPIRVLVVDDHALFRYGVIQTLEERPDMLVVAEAESPSAAIALAMQLSPDIVLVDVKLGASNGLGLVTGLRQQCPSSKIIMLTMYEDEDTLLASLKEGAHAYVLKGVSGEELVQIIRAVAAGETYVTPSLAGRMLRELARPGSTRSAGSRESGFDELTDREKGVLEAVSQGLTNKEIGAMLHLSEKTVKHHMTSILQKLQVRNRVEAALLLRSGQSTRPDE
ncbi:MAG: response regulator transcription factor [Firmicutes bacterium]|nr:response regulator transcription factor [Bacillota bacterium]